MAKTVARTAKQKMRKTRRRRFIQRNDVTSVRHAELAAVFQNGSFVQHPKRSGPTCEFAYNLPLTVCEAYIISNRRLQFSASRPKVCGQYSAEELLNKGVVTGVQNNACPQTS
jgi:hypothetical protein